MTAQASEMILIDGIEQSLCTEPLEYYFGMAQHRPDFDANCTAIHRGYIATWQILNDRLYLIDIDGEISTGIDSSTKVTINDLFPGYTERVFAHWYSGELRIPQGELLHYVHGGYASSYEQDLFIKIVHGIVISQRTQVNSSDTDSSPSDFAAHAEAHL